MRLEREKHFQKAEAERLERKKVHTQTTVTTVKESSSCAVRVKAYFFQRLEEIMKRTRRSDTAEKVKAKRTCVV